MVQAEGFTAFDSDSWVGYARVSGITHHPAIWPADYPSSLDECGWSGELLFCGETPDTVCAVNIGYRNGDQFQTQIHCSLLLYDSDTGRTPSLVRPVVDAR